MSDINLDYSSSSGSSEPHSMSNAQIIRDLSIKLKQYQLENTELKAQLLEMKRSETANKSTISKKINAERKLDAFAEYIGKHYPPEKHRAIMLRYSRNPTFARRLYCNQS